jgi:acetyl-CoA hydrolase
MALLQAMVDERARWTRLDLVMPMLQRRLPVFEHVGEPFHFVTLQASPAFKYLWGHHALRVLPTRYSDYARICAPDGPLPCDAALVVVSPPHRGQVSLGLSVGSTVVPARTAPLVVAQVNPEVPYTLGAGELPVEHFDALVEADDQIVDARARSASDPVSDRIAAVAAAVVPDGATIQFGVGSIPDAILAGLGDRTSLRVHSGLVSEACVDLYEAGVVAAPMVAAEVVSSPRMRRWVHLNPALLMAPPSVTHGAAMLAGIERFVALNSAVEVALDGSANSEVAAGQIVSGPGGAPDFAFGASVSNGGRFVTALKSTAAGGSVSRIVRHIEAPDPTTLPAYLADVVVTEHGRAEVRALAGSERADAIRAVAHPDHRAALA